MMKTKIGIMSIVLVIILAAPAYAEVTGNVNLLSGMKFLQGGSNAWDDVSVQTYFLLPPGIEANIRDSTWPVNINFAYVNSNMLTWMNLITAPLGIVSMEYGETREFDLGIRKIWESAPHVRPYIGVGGTFVWGYMQKTFDMAYIPNASMYLSDTSEGWGGYVEAGIYWEIVQHLNLGVGFAYSQANLRFAGDVIDGDPLSTRGSVTVNGGGFRGNFIIGYHY